jgi:ABC-type transport system involved in cytochrome c biogenesis permease component
VELLGVLASAASDVIGLTVVVLLWFIPSLFAFGRHHRNRWAILALNLLLGWTVLGWIGALLWSFSRPSPKPDVVRAYDEAETPAVGWTDRPADG